MWFFLNIILSYAAVLQQPSPQQEIKIIHELFRLRNEHKVDSAEMLYADTVLVYMKTLRNISRKKITELDREFWKRHPKYYFEITQPVKVSDKNGTATAIIFGKEFLDGKSFIKERIEIKFDRNRKINFFRGYIIK